MGLIVTLIDHTAEPELKIGQSAAICYDADLTDAACLRRVKSVVNKGHLATLRFAYASFFVARISRVCSHQLVRMAHAGILQQSQRYVMQSNVEFVNPPDLALQPDLLQRWEQLQQQAAELYGLSIQAGIKKEDARYILPQGCMTRLNLCLNFQGWRDFLANRTDKTAQWEVRAVALEIQRQLAGIAPQIF